MCRESGHLDICDNRIGEVFAHAPPDPDGSWPCIPVRDVIEDLASESVAESFFIGVLNKRGVVCKSAFEGGEQERELARKFAESAVAFADDWPTTARAMQQLAKNYEDEAAREDDKAATRRLGH